MSHFGLEKYINNNLSKVIEEYNKRKLMHKLNLSIKSYSCILHKFNIAFYEKNEKVIKGCYIYQKIEELSSDNFYINYFEYDCMSSILINDMTIHKEVMGITEALTHIDTLNI